MQYVNTAKGVYDLASTGYAFGKQVANSLRKDDETKKRKYDINIGFKIDKFQNELQEPGRMGTSKPIIRNHGKHFKVKKGVATAPYILKDRQAIHWHGHPSRANYVFLGTTYEDCQNQNSFGTNYNTQFDVFSNSFNCDILNAMLQSGYWESPFDTTTTSDYQNQRWKRNLIMLKKNLPDILSVTREITIKNVTPANIDVVYYMVKPKRKVQKISPVSGASSKDHFYYDGSGWGEYTDTDVFAADFWGYMMRYIQGNTPDNGGAGTRRYYDLFGYQTLDRDGAVYGPTNTAGLVETQACKGIMSDYWYDPLSEPYLGKGINIDPVKHFKLAAGEEVTFKIVDMNCGKLDMNWLDSSTPTGASSLQEWLFSNYDNYYGFNSRSEYGILKIQGSLGHFSAEQSHIVARHAPSVLIEQLRTVKVIYNKFEDFSDIKTTTTNWSLPIPEKITGYTIQTMVDADMKEEDAAEDD